MKKFAILVLLLVCISSGLKAQYDECKKNTIFVCYQPVDRGVGVRYDRTVTDMIGVYGSLSKGDYNFDTDAYINDHIKLSTGVLFFLNSCYEEADIYVGIGLNHNSYGERYNFLNFDPKVLVPISYEMCCNGVLYNRFNIGIRFDFMKGESSIDFGILF